MSVIWYNKRKYSAFGRERGIFMKTVWAKGKQNELNTQLLFQANLKDLKGKVELVLAAENWYTVYAYDHFVSAGPQRGPHGVSFYSTYDVTEFVKDGVLLLTVEVNGCNGDTYCYVNQPPYFAAKILCNGQEVADTDVFACYDTDRVQKVLRYSQQRAFCESYRMQACRSGFYNGEQRFKRLETEVVSARVLRPRFVHEPTYGDVQGQKTACGGITVGSLPEQLWRPNYITLYSLNNKTIWGYRLDEVEEIVIDDVMRFVPCETQGADGSYTVYDLGRNITGFIGTQITLQNKATVYVLFDELMQANGTINPRRMTSVNAVKYVLEPGNYNLLTHEPYTMRYLQVVVFGDEPQQLQVYAKKFENPDAARAQFNCADKEYEAIFEAARNTFAQNAVDVLTDCPSRERAGWLCDSYYSGQSEALFTGECIVEQNFLRNYAEHGCTSMPGGMVPMCYPSSHPNPRYIPNWSMFYILELESYLNRTGDRATIDNAKNQVLGLVKFFEGYENEFGLLEKLSSWVFVEWSFANKCVQDVNFPSNMLWAKCLDAVDAMYGCPDLAKKAQKLRQTVNEWSFNGEFYIDNALRTENGLQLTDNITETCQYYAFFCDVATPQTRPALLQTLCEKFGIHRDLEKVYPNVHPANAFIGNLMRLDYLSGLGKSELVLRQIKEYYLYMSNATGTLWEMDKPTASCNHGFAGYVANLMLRCMTGFVGVNQNTKKVYILKEHLSLDCSAKIPVGSADFVTLTVQNGKREIALPKGYSLA